MYLGFKKGIKDYKVWDLKNKRFMLDRDVMFDEALMVKPIEPQ